MTHFINAESLDFEIPSNSGDAPDTLFGASPGLAGIADTVSVLQTPPPQPAFDRTRTPDCNGARRRFDALTEGERDIYGFLRPDPSWSYASLQANCAQLDVLVPEWFEISGSVDRVKSIEDQFGHDEIIRKLIDDNRNEFALLPIVSLPEWSKVEQIDELVGTEILRDQLVAEIANRAVANDFDGICFDTTRFPVESANYAVDIAQKLDQALNKAELKTCTIADFEGELWLDKALVAASDRMIVTMVRDPFSGSLPAPIAPQQWFAEAAAFVSEQVPSEKLVFALGTEGYDWISGQTTPQRTDYTSIVGNVAHYDGQLQFFDTDMNSQAVYIDAQKNRHVSWFLDAASFHNQLRALEPFPLAGVAVHSIGVEDPGIWDVLAMQGQPLAELLTRLGTISVADGVRYVGQGAFFRLASEAVTGQRSLEVEKDGLFHRMDYTVLPEPIRIERFGQTDSRQLILTFDDGPDPVYTTKILDILKEKGVSATFFVVGKNVFSAPKIFDRIIAEGHVAGSHSFSHPRLETVSPSRARIEINSVQKIVAGLTGRKMILYRTPYGDSMGPDSAQFVQSVRIATSLGYIEMGSDIVTYDWTKISPERIVDYVREGVEAGKRVVMLHDSGGNRSSTVAALGPMIDQMRAEGYTFVSPADQLGLSIADLMPVYESFDARLDGMSINFVVLAKSAFISIFWLTVLLGILRSVTILIAALRRRRRVDTDTDFEPPVTVVIAAYNESAVIERCIRTVLASDYDDLRVIVVDDGSKDDTKDIVMAAFGDDRRVSIRSRPNGGKWRALNSAYRQVTTKFVVAIDADTIVRPDAIRKLMLPFSDERVGAVAGNVKVGNRLNLLTRLQALEYITAQNLERRAFDSINAMLVVPGAIGGWRVAAVRAAGGYSGDTLAEDSDLTVAIHRLGYRVAFAEDAISVTEAPATLVPFMKQRLRWTLGMMQMSWKHRDSFKEGRTVGLVSLIDLQIFGVLFALFAPMADVILLTTVAIAISGALAGQAALDPDASWILLAGYILLPLMDLVLTTTAIYLDRRNGSSERYAQLWALPFQRLFYRQILYLTVYRSVGRALSGRLAKWGTLKRMGTVQWVAMAPISSTESDSCLPVRQQGPDIRRVG